MSIDNDEFKLLKEHLSHECTFQLDDDTMNLFLSKMESFCLKKNETLIPSGAINTNIYIIQDGILRYSYFDKDKETTEFFATSGTMVYSYHSYYSNQPSFYQISACCPTKMLKITKHVFDQLIAEHHDFCQWILSMAFGALYFSEKKRKVIQGAARDRFLSFCENRPEIIRNVSSKNIASYLRITESYLCRLKKLLLTSH